MDGGELSVAYNFAIHWKKAENILDKILYLQVRSRATDLSGL